MDSCTQVSKNGPRFLQSSIQIQACRWDPSEERCLDLFQRGFAVCRFSFSASLGPMAMNVLLDNAERFQCGGFWSAPFAMRMSRMTAGSTKALQFAISSSGGGITKGIINQSATMLLLSLISATMTDRRVWAPMCSPCACFPIEQSYD